MINMKNLLKIITCLILIFCFSPLEAKEKKKDVDSLYKLYKQTKNAEKKIEVTTEFAWALREISPDTALYWALKAQKMIKSDTKKTIIGYNSHIIGSIYSLLGDYEESEKWLIKAYEIRKKYEKNKRELLITTTNLFYTYQGLGKIKEMHHFISEAERLIAEMGEEGTSMHIITVLQMAEMYRSLQQKDKAEKNFHYAIKLAEEVNKEDYYLSMVYTNFGNYLVSEENYTEALKYFEKAAVHNAKLNDSSDHSLDVNMAIAYAETGQTDKAKRIFEKIYELSKSENNFYGKSTASNNLGFFTLMMGDAKKALPLFIESLGHAKKAGAGDLVADRYLMISDCHEKLGDYKKSLEFLKLHQAQKDSLLDAETLKQLNILTAKYDDEKKEKKILEYKQKEAESKLREKENEEALNAEKEQSKRNMIIFVSLIVVVLVIAGFIFYSYRQKKNANLALEEKNKKIETQHLLLEEKHKEITDSINYAKRIQSALLTSDEYWKQISSDLFVYFRPKDVVSGDFFWAFQTETKEGTIAIWCAADCTGHGVPGAFMSMLGISFLNEIVVEQGETNPSEILNKLREKIIKALEQKSVDIKQRDGMDMALCVWNKSKKTLDFAGANNPLWIIRSERGQETGDMGEEKSVPTLMAYGYSLYEYKADKMPVGSYADALIPFNMKNIPIQKGDMIYTFSDGYSDQFGGEKGKKFKESNFKKLLLEIHSNPAEKQKERIHDNFENWKGQLEQIDDVCVIGVRV